jgi:exonuclease SbcC
VLLIDEGLESLDAVSLDLAVEALETLQGLGRKVGMVTHVAAMVKRITTQVRVVKRSGGRSVVEVHAARRDSASSWLLRVRGVLTLPPVPLPGATPV